MKYKRIVPFEQATPPLTEGQPIPITHWMHPEYEHWVPIDETPDNLYDGTKGSIAIRGTEGFRSSGV